MSVQFRLFSIMAAAAISTAGCGASAGDDSAPAGAWGDAGSTATDGTTSSDGHMSSSDASSWGGADTFSGSGGATGTDGATGTGPTDGTDGWDGVDGFDGTDGTSGTDGGSGIDGTSGVDAVDSGTDWQPTAGLLTAGEWRDLDEWSFWRGLFDSPAWQNMEAVWGFDTARRIPVRVTSSDEPVVDAAVTLTDANGAPVWAARTDNQGRAELFVTPTAAAETAGEGNFTVTATRGELTASETDVAVIPDDLGAVVTLELAEAPSTEQILDLMLVIDTTGSMGDELSFLQTELLDVIQEVQSVQGVDLQIRTSVNFFRDTTDEYVVRPFPFTTPEQAAVQLGDQTASGGGDTPEAVHSALENALNEHEWSPSARARLLILVLDAPPHGQQVVLNSVQESAERAAELGVRIIPLTGSGIQKNTEFLMRALAVVTGGTYVFLTDDSGVGGGHIESHVEGPEQTIGEVTIEPLNTLLKRVINDAVK